MHSEIITTMLGHSLLGSVLAVLGLATAFWLFFAFRSARSAIRELSALNQALQAGKPARLRGQAQ
jgi:hypothetical protein